MKVRLGMEQLEDRRTLSSWSVKVLDTQNLIPTSVENQMKDAGWYVMWELDQRVSWKGTLDMVINVCPNDPNHDGSMNAVLQVMAGGKNATIYEMQTGIDPMPNNPDLGVNVFVGRDGTVKVYGMSAYFDPNPGPYTPADVPGGYFDVIGVFAHECAHGLAFQAGTTDFNRYMTFDSSGNRFFNGPETMRLLGRPLPLTRMGSTHYGNGALPDNPINSGLMYEWGNFAGNRLNWGKLDFAVLKDVGINVKNTQGLPFLDTMDSQLPRLVAFTTAISENRPAGTLVTEINTTRGPNYTFQLASTFDGGSFRLDGNKLVTTMSFDYEQSRVRTVYVRMTDSDGQWIAGRLDIRILDVFEPPVLVVPPSLIASGTKFDWINFSKVKIQGNRDTQVTVTITADKGTIGYYSYDRSVQIAAVRNGTGGTNFTISGTAENVGRNMSFVSGNANGDSVTVQLSAVGRVWGSFTLGIVRPKTLLTSRIYR